MMIICFYAIFLRDRLRIFLCFLFLSDSGFTNIKNIGVVMMTKTVLVTGSSRGLGATIVKTLAQQDFQVVINYYKSKNAAERLISEIGEQNAVAIQADVTERQEVDQLVKKATEYFGQIDVVVNNALIDFKFDPTEQKPFTELTWDD